MDLEDIFEGQIHWAGEVDIEADHGVCLTLAQLPDPVARFALSQIAFYCARDGRPVRWSPPGYLGFSRSFDAWDQGRACQPWRDT